MLDETNYKIDENNSLLILDDDQPFLKRLSVAMEKRGFNVFPASSMAVSYTHLRAHETG